MNKVLVTGGGHFLDYHVIKRLNERGIRPRSLVLPPARREAWQLALSRSRPGFEVVVVAPALTIRPEDFGPAPGGSLIKRVVTGRFVPTVDMGVGLRRRERFPRRRPARGGARPSRPTLRPMCPQPHPEGADRGDRRRRRDPGAYWHLPRWLPRLLIAALVFWSRIRGKEPPVPPTIAKLIGRYGWYDAPPNARRPRLATAAPARDPGRHGALVSGAPLGSAPFTGAQEVKHDDRHPCPALRANP